MFLLSEILKRFIEYKADKYVVQCGYDRETLISAFKIQKIDIHMIAVFPICLIKEKAGFN